MTEANEQVSRKIEEACDSVERVTKFIQAFPPRSIGGDNGFQLNHVGMEFLTAAASLFSQERIDGPSRPFERLEQVTEANEHISKQVDEACGTIERVTHFIQELPPESIGLDDAMRLNKVAVEFANVVAPLIGPE